MMEYFNYKKTKKHQDTIEKSEAPVLTDEDEAFLQRITTEGTPPPFPERPQDLPEAGSTKGNDAQIALMNGAQDIALPDVPDTPEGVLVAIEGDDIGKGKEKAHDGKRKMMWSFIRRDSRDKNRTTAATDLDSIAQGLKSVDAQPNEDGKVSDHEAKKEEEEMTSVLEQLNLAAVNNRVFSISKESQELLRKFTLVLKDLINGVPTAYDDLESLLTNSEHQLQSSYKHLPSFLQKLIESLPSKMTGTLGPEILAVAAERQGLKSEYVTQATGIASKLGMKVKVPSLKDLVTKPGAVASMLRTIMNFLKLRFPAFMGMNVLWSLALFVLLFVFWYCHKRGRETRLEKERLLTEAEAAQLEEKIANDPAYEPSQPRTTTAPEGASIEEVAAGMIDAQAAEAAGEAAVPREGEASYAAEGSLARDMEKQKAAASQAEAGVRVREVDEDSVVGNERKMEEQRRSKAARAERRRVRGENAVSKAPLDRQESCVVS
ncbi:hypothetical protein MMC15_003795 [Xylographa vitiligo]|nr:hypothetical protein [Xylographa vitiligo]